MTTKTLAAALTLLALTGCGTHTTLTAAPARTAAVAAQGAVIGGGGDNQPACTPNTPPVHHFGVTAATDLAFSCLQVTGFHNFGGSGSTALLLGTQNGAPLTINVSDFRSFDDSGTQVSAFINNAQTAPAVVAALIQNAPLTDGFGEQQRAVVLGMLQQ